MNPQDQSLETRAKVLRGKLLLDRGLAGLDQLQDFCAESKSLPQLKDCVVYTDDLSLLLKAYRESFVKLRDCLEAEYQVLLAAAYSVYT